MSTQFTSYLHAGYSHPILRKWQSNQCVLQKSTIIYPVFVSDKPDAYEEISSLPGQHRVGTEHLVKHLEPLINKGLKALLLFGVIESLPKDSSGSSATSPSSPVLKALQLLRTKYPHILLCADLCLCAYTDHGHCGILRDNGAIDNQASIKRLAEVAVEYARHGAHVIAPSDMMDSRVHTIKSALTDNGFGNTVAVMSYSAKFASGLYGPFRDAAHSAPSHGDRKAYQLPPQSRGLARRAVQRDIQEGADILMVKPGIAYLDIIRDTREFAPDYPLAVYQVSGEYAMTWHAAKHGVFDLKVGIMEQVNAFLRAGANIIITYWANELLDIVHESARE